MNARPASVQSRGGADIAGNHAVTHLQVGVVRQVESAALKSVGSNKSAPFERRISALYTAATLDANLRADKLGERLCSWGFPLLRLLRSDPVHEPYSVPTRVF